jgi:hypothetical protein
MIVSGMIFSPYETAPLLVREAALTWDGPGIDLVSDGLDSLIAV